MRVVVVFFVSVAHTLDVILVYSTFQLVRPKDEVGIIKELLIQSQIYMLT